MIEPRATATRAGDLQVPASPSTADRLTNAEFHTPVAPPATKSSVTAVRTASVEGFS